MSYAIAVQVHSLQGDFWRLQLVQIINVAQIELNNVFIDTCMYNGKFWATKPSLPPNHLLN